MTRLLVVEDDPTLREVLADTLADEGYDVTTACDGDAGRELLFSRHFDLVVLDVLLPGRSGLELLRELRDERVATPVLLLTARSDEGDKVHGLELGAEDYVTKPFGMRELLARVRVLLRRRGAAGAPEVFRVGAARVDLGTFELERGGEVSRLSPKEAEMLRLLFRARGAVVRRERFLDEVWGSECFVGTRTVDTHVLNLRHKLEPDPKRPRHLLTVHGVGYRLVLDGGPDDFSTTP